MVYLVLMAIVVCFRQTETTAYLYDTDEGLVIMLLHLMFLAWFSNEMYCGFKSISLGIAQADRWRFAWIGIAR
jgi:hypothetical protein